MQFLWGKIAQILGWRPHLWGLGTQILDPPLFIFIIDSPHCWTTTNNLLPQV